MNNEKQIKDLIRDLADGIKAICNNLESGRDDIYPDIWREATRNLRIFSEEVKDDKSLVFPSNLFEQNKWLKESLESWPIPGFKETFENDALDNDTRLFEEAPTEYCDYMADDYEDIFNNKDLKPFKKIMSTLRNNSQYEEYTKIREFLIRKPVVTNLKMFTRSLPEEIRADFIELYEDVPEHYYMDDEAKICPYCGWTLKRKINGEYRCDDEKCYKRTALAKGKSMKGRLLRVKPGVRKYITYPGVQEIKLFDYFKSKPDIESILYPEADIFDLQLNMSNGEVWVIDVKDWGSVIKLVSKLNEDNNFIRGKSSRISWNKAFLVIPDYYSVTYLRKLDEYWKRDKSIQVMSISELKKYIRNSKETNYED